MLIGPDRNNTYLLHEAEKPIVNRAINQLLELIGLVGSSSFSVFISLVTILVAITLRFYYLLSATAGAIGQGRF